VIITQSFANAKAHLAQDDFKSDSARIALHSRQDALDENVSLVLRVVKRGGNKEPNNALLFIEVEPLRMSSERTNVAVQTAQNETLGPGLERRGRRNRAP
jgi:hypothetical protein